MVEEQPNKQETNREPPLPRAPVLEYLTNAAATSTRVRQVTAKAMLWIAMLLLLMATVAVAGVWDFAQYVGERLWSMYSSGHWYIHHWIRWLRWKYYFWECYLIVMMLAVMAVPTATTLLCCMGAVRRGRTGVCRLCSVLMVMLVLAGGFGAALLAAWALYMGTGLYRPPASRLHLLGLAGTAALTLLTLLMWDVRNYLRWIAQTPLSEKPPVPFLPRKTEPRA